MIITRTIAPGVIRVSSFVFELLRAFPVKYIELVEYRENNELNNFIIDVNVLWDAADDLALDALIAAHNPVPISPITEADLYKRYDIPAPVATNSQVFQLVTSENFFALDNWIFEFNYLYQLSIANNTQQGEVEFRLNGVPFLTSRLGIRNGTITPFGGELPLEGFVNGQNTLDIYIRKVSGNALITMQELYLSTKWAKDV